MLVGLSGSGKTTVGREVARRLGCAFADIDAAIERREGMSITTLFAERGEAAFRALERAEVSTALAGPPLVIAPGAGWAVQEGALDAVAESGIVVWLDVSVAEAARRLGSASERPLLAEDVAGRLAAQAEAREPSYAGAEAVCRTDGKTVEQVTDEVVVLARRLAGW